MLKLANNNTLTSCMPQFWLVGDPGASTIRAWWSARQGWMVRSASWVRPKYWSESAGRGRQEKGNDDDIAVGAGEIARHGVDPTSPMKPKYSIVSVLDSIQ
jgi:hypothetical protein